MKSVFRILIKYPSPATCHNAKPLRSTSIVGMLPLGCFAYMAGIWGLCLSKRKEMKILFE